MRAEGLGYRRIARLIGCSRTTVQYHVIPSARQRDIARKKKWYDETRADPLAAAALREKHNATQRRLRARAKEAATA
jgi:hypothetical protein